jgi:branched-chain amino acid transport system ATP-binding protein
MLISVQSLNVFYGKAQIIHDLDLTIEKGETVALVGRNGAGKSTVMKALCGLVPARSGSICYQDHEIRHLPPYQIARRGIAFVPEDRQIFPNLTTEENLRLATFAFPSAGRSLEGAYDVFPALRVKRDTLGQNLSGGEQQMLAIARALLTKPELILLDEPTEGLAPVIVEAVISALMSINAAGISLLVVEQNFKFTSMLATRQYVLDSGRIQWSGTTQEFVNAKAEIEKILIA